MRMAMHLAVRVAMQGQRPTSSHTPFLPHAAVTTVDPAGPIATSTAAVGDAVSATQNAEGARATASLAACGGDSTAVINARAVSSTTWATVSGAGSASPTVNLGPDYAPTTTVALGTDAPVAKGATDACAALTTASEGATGTASTLSSSTGGRSSAPAASGKGGVVSQDSIKGTTDGAVHQHATRASACGLALAGLAGALLL